MSDEGKEDTVLQFSGIGGANRSIEPFGIGRFKLVNGKNDTATLLPLKIKGGSYIECNKIKIPKSSNKVTNPKLTKFLTEDWAEFICNKVNARQEINSQTINQEINSGSDVNAYKNAMLKETEGKKDPPPMEEWSI